MGAESLQAACELAYAVARTDAESDVPVEPPASMKSFLYVEDLPKRAVTVAQQAIEDDSDFRSRVASQASEDLVGRAGYLWLHRPGGWAQEFERLTSDDAEHLDEAYDEVPASDDTAMDDTAMDDPVLGDPAASGTITDEPAPEYGDGDGVESEQYADTPAEPMLDAEPVMEAEPIMNADFADQAAAQAPMHFDPQPPPPQEIDLTAEPMAAEPDPEIEEVYNEILSAPVELVNAQPPEPTDPDFDMGSGDDFSPESPPIADAPMASVSLIGGPGDVDPPPPSFELASMGAAAVTDRANYDAPNDGDFPGYGEPEDVIVESPEMDFEADALENELSSLRGLVDRLAGEREMVVSNLPAETPSGKPAEPVVSESVLESEIMALESDLDNAHHELKLAKADLETARHEREEAQKHQSDALRRQVDLEKELAAVREQRIEVENQASEAQVSVISLEDKIARVQNLLDEAEREKNITKSQLDTMTSERNQLREDRVSLKAERDDLFERVTDMDEKTGGLDVGEVIASNKSMTVELDATSRELARMIAQAESLEEQIATVTATADELKTSNVEMSSRLADTELALETTRTQHEALKVDSERLAAEVGTRRADNDALQTQVSELQASLADSLNEQAESRQRNDADRQELNELRIERDVTMARMNDLEQADRDYEVRINTLSRERDDLIAARDDLVNERGQLRGEATAAANEKEQLVEKLYDAESKIGPLETELQAERRQREELANRLLELDDIADQNAAELARLNEERGSMVASIEELEAERINVNELAADRDEFANRLRDAEQRLEEDLAGSQQQIVELTDQLTAAEEGRVALAEQVSELTGELDTLRMDSSEASNELSRLKAAEDQTNTALSEAQATIESLSSEIQAAREARAEAETQLALSDQARSSLTEQLESQTELAQMRATELEAAEARIAEAKVAEAEARIAAEVNALAAENAAKLEEENQALAGANALIGGAVDTESDTETDAEDGDSALFESLQADADDDTKEDDATDAEPDTDPSMVVGVGTGPEDTVHVDLTALPKPVDEPVIADDEATAPLDSNSFLWPTPSIGADDNTDELGVAASADIDLTADDDLGLSPIATPPSGLDDDEDDLDEVSELIAQTVSSFNQSDNLIDQTDPLDALDDQDVMDIPDPLLGDEDSTQSLPEIAGAPPSLFGSKDADPTKQDSPDQSLRRPPGRKRRQIEIPNDIMDDEVAVAQFVVSSPDVVLLVDGDSVAKLGWPSYAVAQQRDALVTYLADLSASSGAAPDVVFDGRIGDDESLPASRAVRIRLSTPPTEPAAALDELVDAYPEQWPIALVTDDPDLAGSATDRGAAVLNNGQLLDLFISE